MSKVQNITSPSGDTMVVMSAAEYEALLDQIDIARVAGIHRAVEAGERETFPGELIGALLEDGASPVKLLREHRGWTASAVAAKAGISQAYFSEIESGKKEGSLRSLQKIATALGVSLEMLLPRA
ncbi:helix-turn-helix protein, partial [Breoghania corrubedonensis]